MEMNAYFIGSFFIPFPMTRIFGGGVFKPLPEPLIASERSDMFDVPERGNNQGKGPARTTSTKAENR